MVRFDIELCGDAGPMCSGRSTGRSYGGKSRRIALYAYAWRHRAWALLAKKKDGARSILRWRAPPARPSRPGASLAHEPAPLVVLAWLACREADPGGLAHYCDKIVSRNASLEDVRRWMEQSEERASLMDKLDAQARAASSPPPSDLPQVLPRPLQARSRTPRAVPEYGVAAPDGSCDFILWSSARVLVQECAEDGDERSEDGQWPRQIRECAAGEAEEWGDELDLSLMEVASSIAQFLGKCCYILLLLLLPLSSLPPPPGHHHLSLLSRLTLFDMTHSCYVLLCRLLNGDSSVDSMLPHLSTREHSQS